jgi:hypothetical protein
VNVFKRVSLARSVRDLDEDLISDSMELHEWIETPDFLVDANAFSTALCTLFKSGYEQFFSSAEVIDALAGCTAAL